VLCRCGGRRLRTAARKKTSPSFVHVRVASGLLLLLLLPCHCQSIDNASARARVLSRVARSSSRARAAVAINQWTRVTYDVIPGAGQPANYCSCREAGAARVRADILPSPPSCAAQIRLDEPSPVDMAHLRVMPCNHATAQRGRRRIIAAATAPVCEGAASHGSIRFAHTFLFRPLPLPAFSHKFQPHRSNLQTITGV